MAGLFGGDKPSPSMMQNPINLLLPKPRPVRMPVDSDPSVLGAAERLRESALKRTGRRSTILTDNFNPPSGTAMGSY
jgi:hypothetical protein